MPEEMAQTFHMPMRGERTAPKFDTTRPRELPRYFEDLEQLMTRANATEESDKKKHTVHYADVDTEHLWKSLPEFEDPASTYDKFKDAIMEHYPEAAGDFLYSIRDIDLLTGERQRLGITSVKDLSDYHLHFMTITTWLIKKQQLSKLEQERAYTRAFPMQLLASITTRLQFSDPNHHPGIPYQVTEVYNTARSILQGMSSIGFISQPITAPILPTENPIKTETLAPFMAEFTKTIIEALKGTNLSQRQIERIIECIMCGGKHGIHDCKIVDEFAKAGKCRRNHENKVVLPNGSFVPRYITGRYLADRIEEWHRQNPIQQTASTMVHTIKSRTVNETQPYPAPYRQFNTAYALSSDERITTMEAELFNLKKAREVQVAAVRTRAQHQNRAPANNTDEQDVQQARKAIPRIDEVEEPAPRQPTVSTSNSQPTIPEHPYRNARDAAYAPPVNRNVAAPYKPSNDKRPEPAYKTLPPVHDPTIAANVYKRSMDAPITITQRELLSMSPEVRSQYRDSTTTRRMPYNNGNTAQNYLKMETGVADKQPTYAAEQSSFTFENTTNRALPEEALILPDPIEEYYNTLRHGEQPDPNQLIVAVESGAVRTILAFIDNKEQKECILDPGCQVVAMSEATCHQLGLAYDPSIILNMVSANGNINQSLGLARNVPFQVGSITFYLQVHIIQSPAYDVLLGRPFDILTESIVRNFNNQDQTITISDPNTGRRVTVPTLNRNTKSKHCTHQKEEDF